MLNTPSLEGARKLYHGTSSVNLDCIKTIGLVPGYAKGGDAWAKEHHMLVGLLSSRREPSVFLAEDVINASTFACYAAQEMGGDPVVVELHVPEPVFKTFIPDELYSRDKRSKPHAWRAHSVDAAYVAEIVPIPKKQQLCTLMDLLAALHGGATYVD